MVDAAIGSKLLGALLTTPSSAAEEMLLPDPGGSVARCWDLDWSKPIQEGSVDVNTGMVNAIGRVCRSSDGLIDRGKTWMGISVTETWKGDQLGYDYWERATNQINDSRALQEWRFYGAYKNCVKIVGLEIPVCTKTG